MLNRSEGDLANLIIHEMSHATIFVKDSVDFNENLATFIGDRGAEKFLIYKYGLQSKEYRDYINEDVDYLKFVDHMLRGAQALDSLYNKFGESTPLLTKKEKKQQLIESIVNNMDTLTLALTSQPSSRFKDRLPNNAYFMNFRQYQSQQPLFWEDYEKQFQHDLKAYIQFMKTKYPFL